MRRLTLCLGAIGFVGCANAPLREQPYASPTELIGTWKPSAVDRGRLIQVFLADGTYCTRESMALRRPHSIGTWSTNATGELLLRTTRSEDPSLLTPADVSEIRRTFVTSPSEIVMGPPCPHCDDGIAGVEYRRATSIAHCTEP